MPPQAPLKILPSVKTKIGVEICPPPSVLLSLFLSLSLSLPLFTSFSVVSCLNYCLSFFFFSFVHDPLSVYMYLYSLISPSVHFTLHPFCTLQFSSPQLWRKTVTTILAANSTLPDTCSLFTDPDKWRVLCADETLWRCESAICHRHKQILLLLLLLQSFQSVHRQHTKFPSSFLGVREICRIDSPHLPALSVRAAVLMDAI
jgi:hypothetical protein